MNLSRNLKIKIALIVVGFVLIASGVFLAATKFKSSPDNAGSVTVSPKTEVTDSAKKKEEPKEEDEKESKKGEIQGVASQVVYEPTIPTTKPTPKPPTTTKPKPPLDSVSAAKLNQKLDRFYDYTGNLSDFINGIDLSIPYFPTLYLTAAQAKLDASKSYDSLIKPNGTLANDAFTNCKLADKYYQEELYDYWNSINFANSGEWDIYWNLWDSANQNHSKGYSHVQTCLADLNALGY